MDYYIYNGNESTSRMSIANQFVYHLLDQGSNLTNIMYLGSDYASFNQYCIFLIITRDH